MSANEGCALNTDGILKAANKIHWLHSPTQESVQLRGGQLSSRGLTVQVFAVNPQPPTINPSAQPPSQPVIGKNPKKRGWGKVGGGMGTFGTLQFVETYCKDLCCQEAASKRAMEEAARITWTKTSAI
jgi:hypothetical protein